MNFLPILPNLLEISTTLFGARKRSGVGEFAYKNPDECLKKHTMGIRQH
ncbi:MAG: hypothetical protein WCA35_14660 [Kovacikia sp.]